MTMADADHFCQIFIGLGQGVQLYPVDWALPPGMKFIKQENWCGQKDLIRLHALGPFGRTFVAKEVRGFCAFVQPSKCFLIFSTT